MQSQHFIIFQVIVEGNLSILIGSALKITAGHRTMSGQDDYLSGQNLALAVILTGHERGFQIIN